MATTTLSPTQIADATFTAPYPPSWFDRFKVWVERLPGPPWLFYLLLGIALYIPIALIQWQTGGYPIGTLNVFHLWIAMQSSFSLVVMHYLDRIAETAFIKIKPSLNVAPDEAERLRYELTTMPARLTFWVCVTFTLSIVLFIVVGLLFFPVDLLTTYQGSTQPLALGFLLFVFALTYWCGAAFVLHTFRQLRLVSRIYTKYVTVNLFDLGPLYGFSGVTALTAIAFLIYAYIWAVTDVESNQTVVLVSNIPNVLLAIVVFVLPLRGAHSRIVQEKDRVLGETTRAMRLVIDSLHQAAHSQQYNDAPNLTALISGLEIEKRTVEKVPTWPWSPDTLRTVITALLLPIVLFVIQFFVQRFLAP